MQEAQPAEPEPEPEHVEGEVVPDDASDTRYDPSWEREEEPPVGIGHEVVPAPPHEQPIGTLFGTSDPQEVIERVTKVSTTLKDILRKQKLTQRIGSNDHVKVEGWQTLGSMIGVFPVKEYVEEIPWPQPLPQSMAGPLSKGLAFGFKASYRVQTLNGAVVGGAEGACKRTEQKWAGRDDYALMSMAQTRAMSKALKAPLGFIVTMAGYEATPAEEMDGITQEGTYGPPMSAKPEDLERLNRAVLFLVNDGGLAQFVIDSIISDATGYMPRIVYRALLHTARAARDGVEQEQREQESDGSDGDADTDPGYGG
jgi:hypothetical protein